MTSKPTRAAMIAQRLAIARAAQPRWAASSVRRRLGLVRSLRHQLVRHADRLLETIRYPGRNGPAETLAAELIPLADACRFLERTAPRILAPQRASRRARPLWLTGVSVEQRREPWGAVLVVGAANYPLFLTGVQTIQALVAGNAVLVKPGRDASSCTGAFKEVLVAAGLDERLVQVLPESTDAVAAAIAAGVDKVVLTGSATAGRAVSRLAGDALIPTTMELSGCDAVFILEGADLDQVARSLAFGLRFNGSGTCIAPRRVFVPACALREFEVCLRQTLDEMPPVANRISDQTLALVQAAIQQGAQPLARGPCTDGFPAGRPIVLTDISPEVALTQQEIFEPVLCILPMQSLEDALRANQRCPYALGATVFGPSQRAQALAKRIDAGCVVINDMIAPTADPRIAFGGRRQSGFGVTRGRAGLEAMTQIKTVVQQRGQWKPHLEPTSPFDAALLRGFLQCSHGGTWRSRWNGLISAIRAGIKQHQWKSQHHPSQSESHTCPTNESRSSAAA